MKTRDKYVSRLKRQLDAWNADIARWEKKAKGAKAEVKERYRRELAVLAAQRELARYNLRLLENASVSAWTELRQGADEAWARMRQAAGIAGGYFEKAKAKAKARAKGKGRAKAKAKGRSASTARARPAARRKRKAR